MRFEDSRAPAATTPWSNGETHNGDADSSYGRVSGENPASEWAMTRAGPSFAPGKRSRRVIIMRAIPSAGALE